MNLWRTCTVALFIALVGNVWLWRISGVDDSFANIIAIASGVAAAGLVISHFVHRIAEIALGLSFIVWVANAIEFATEDDVSTNSQVRQGGFYVALAIISLGCWLACRDRRYGL